MPDHTSLPGRTSFHIDETQEIPPLGMIFGWGPMVPFVVGAIAAWTFHDATAIRLTIIWGGAILAFLAGVRRGLSFRTPGGEAFAQIATMLLLFTLALAALASPWPIPAVMMLLAGYITVAILDPRAAARRQVPLFFARLRPIQMMVPIASLAVIICRLFYNG